VRRLQLAGFADVIDTRDLIDARALLDKLR